MNNEDEEVENDFFTRDFANITLESDHLESDDEPPPGFQVKIDPIDDYNINFNNDEDDLMGDVSGRHKLNAYITKFIGYCQRGSKS